MITWTRGQGRWLALAVLILINIVLMSLLAVRHASYATVPATVPPPSSDTDRENSPASSATPSNTPAPSATPAPSTPAPDEPTPSAARGRMLAANSGRIAWRAEEGPCSEPATVEVTTDGGRTWRKTDPGIRSIVQLASYGAGAVFAVGADANCRPTYAWIDAPGGTWRRDPSVIWDVWFRYPADRNLVHAPGGGTSHPCGKDLVALAGIGSYQGAALCRDGRIRTIRARGDWETVLSHSGALSLNADGSSFVAAQPNAACDELVARRFGSTGTGLRRAPVCVPALRGAVALNGSHTWLWRDDVTSVS